MKKLLIVTGLVFGFANVSAQTVSLDKDNIEFGEVKVNTKNKAQIVVTNTGDKPLKIERVQPSCGCTVPSFTKEEILPGKTGKIDVEYNSGTTSGAFNKTVTVYSNDPASPRKVFRVKGTAVN
ncbi:DUF1573 domain-containing protein [Vaginella massiliensis]|uniref:DUF1573 domain-containing protein n=1 Tax=Vaginella massiliensis TaxID=1816680 RepID=UPI000839224A|nr:DUF1573 domain-containing protein [Vaginella massiliensis]